VTPFERAEYPADEVARAVAETLRDFRARPDFYAELGIVDENRLAAWVKGHLAAGEVWKNELYTVALYRNAGPQNWPALLHLSIKRNDREPIRDWRELQRVKNAILSAEREAVELFPAESRRVDSANQYHLFAPGRAGAAVPVRLRAAAGVGRERRGPGEAAPRRRILRRGARLSDQYIEPVEGTCETRVPGSPVDLPERRVGIHAIKHRVFVPGVPVAVVDQREAFLTRRKVEYVTYDVPVRVHQLVQLHPWGERVWMTDEPRELRQIDEMLAKVRPSGRVLVGGPGLGILAAKVRDLPGVAAVTVVELSPDVIQLCRPGGVSIIGGDLHDFLLRTDVEFDHYLLDVWQGTNESTWWSEVMPLRRRIARRWGRKPVWCWAESIMLGRVIRAIPSMGGRGWFYKALEPDMAPAEALAFVRDVGLPAWERRWGRRVSEVMNRMASE